MMDRRGFLKNATLVSAACLMDFREALAWGAKDAEVGKAWKGWKKGQFQIHLIYTGVSGIDVLDFPRRVQRCCLIVVIIMRLGAVNWLCRCFPIPIGMPGSGSHAMSGE